MSHWTTKKTKITDLSLLAKAVEKMGLKLEIGEGLTMRGYRGARLPADAVIRTSVGYDIGFVRQQDGTHEVVADWWGVTQDRHVALDCKQPDEILAAFAQGYAVETVMAQVAGEMATVSESQEEDGTVALTVTLY